MATELGTAYVSIVAETAKLESGIKSAISAGGKNADIIGKQIGQKLSGGLNETLTRAGTNSADVFGKTFSPKVASAGRSAMQGLAQAMIGGADGIGSEIGGGISGGLVRNVSKGADAAVMAIGKIGASGSGMADGLLSAGTVAAGGVALIATAAIATGTELYKMGEQWDSISDNITFKTGMVGEQLDSVTKSIKNVANDSSAALTDIANVSSALIQGLKLTPGDGFEKLTKQISDYNEMAQSAGVETLNLTEFIKAMKQYNISGDINAMSTTLDHLYDISQHTTIPLNTLISTLRTMGVQAKEFKIPMESAIQILAAFDDAGLTAENATMGLRMAMNKLNKEADPAGALRQRVQTIHDLANSTDEASQAQARQIAQTTFGTRSWQVFFDAIKSGKLDVDNLNTSVSSTGSTIEGTRKSTEDFSEAWTKFGHNLGTIVQPAAAQFFNYVNSQLEALLTGLKWVQEAAHKLFGDANESGSEMPGRGGHGIAPDSGISLGGAPGAQRERRGAGLPSDGSLTPGIGVPGVHGGGRGYIGNSGDPVERWRPMVQQALAQYGPQYGITNMSAWEQKMMTQIRTESAGNPSVFNNYDSNAQAGHPSRGLLQFIPSTFAQHNITGGDIMDPYSQIAAFIPYVSQRYGMDKNGAPLQVGRGVGYDSGGWLQPGVTHAVNNTGQPEAVFTQSQLQDMRTSGAIPAAAGSTAKAGSSAISSAIDMGGEVINGIIDQAASAVSSAASAAAMAGSFGAGGPEGGMAAGQAAQFAIGLGTSAAKRGVTYGFDMLGIGADSLLQQLTPFGQPRWLNQDYSGFMPKQAITGALGNLMSGGAQQAADPAGSLLNPKTKEHGTTMGGAPGPIDNLMGNIDPQSPNPMISDANSFLSTQPLAAEAPAPNQPPMFKVDNIYTQDVDSLGRELNKQGRLAQMQYTNRPGP